MSGSTSNTDFVTGVPSRIAPVLAFIVPYELMNVNYGNSLLKHLATELSRIDVYIPDDKAFKAIDQDAVILILSKKGSQKNKVNVHRVKSLSDLKPLSSRRLDLKVTENLSIDLKSFLIDQDTIKLLHQLRQKLKTVSDYCNSSTGIVTAANDFFILTREDVERLQLEPWARKILKKGSFLSTGPRFMRRHFSQLEKSQPCYLIDFDIEPPIALSRKAREYIAYGESQELDQRYKCRNRKPWYRVPIVPVSEGFFFKRSHLFPRLCSNDAKVLVTDTAYQIRMREGFDLNGLIYSFYNSLTLLFAEIDGRFYGGGVLELTPSEFKGLPISYMNPSKKEYVNFLGRFSKSSDSVEAILSTQDDLLRRTLKISVHEMKRIQEALEVIRNHRLRHGRTLK